MTPAANVVNFARTRPYHEVPEGINEIVGVYIVSDLLALVTKYRVRIACHGAMYEIGKEAMQWRRRMTRASHASAAKATSLEAEVAAIFLHKYVGGQFW